MLRRALNSIHKPLLGAVEEEDGEEHHDNEGDRAIKHAPEIEGAYAEAGVFECLEDGGEGVDVQEGLVFFRGEGEGIDNGGGVHQELNTEADEHVEVTVLGGERGDNESP